MSPPVSRPFNNNNPYRYSQAAPHGAGNPALHSTATVDSSVDHSPESSVESHDHGLYRRASQDTPPTAAFFSSKTSLYLRSEESAGPTPASSEAVLRLSEKFSLSPSPLDWGTPVLVSQREDDDCLHNPDPQRDRKNDRQVGRSAVASCMTSPRNITNVGCLIILVLGILVLFAGYPMISHFTRVQYTTQGGFNLGGTNATGQIPSLLGNFGLIDRDTPAEAYRKFSYLHEEELELVFSDEFNRDGRTFYPGDDPYWEAVDLHYWGTKDLEWYDPSQVTTAEGALQITLEEVPDASLNHNMSYKSGMLQTWNQFCFTGGLIEASVRLPGSSSTSGLWPAVWTMGNLGRAGYGATNDGMWPYSYDACDVGTFPNQTYPGTSTPIDALRNGDKYHDDVLSFLSGQRLSRCTCKGESHPGPLHKDGTHVGRSAPEIDMIEAIVEHGVGKVSLSAQWAPFNANYTTLYETSIPGSMIFDDPEITDLNEFRGSVVQQATSGLAFTNASCYEQATGPGAGCFTRYGFEYKPGFDDAYITWYNNDKRAWTLFQSAMGPDSLVEIDARPVPQEPMYIIANLGISHNFGRVDPALLSFPATMSIEYIRVYQRKDRINVGCDPKEFPTAAYIETYKDAYTNPNLTTWAELGAPWPKNELLNGGCD